MQTFSEWVQFGVSSAVVILLLAVVLVLLILVLKKSSKKSEAIPFTLENLNKTLEMQREHVYKHILTHKHFAQRHKEQLRAEKRKSKGEADSDKKRVFVLDFDGDLMASANESTRDIISVLLGILRPTDEVVVRLESAGGVVHGYGLAASQLARVTDRKIRLTVCIDKIAASGGYMMACVANRIVAAPFSIIGSIGVVSSMPNFNRLLKKHDIDYIEQTAGEYKRTLSLFGELSESKKTKHQQDIDVIHGLFKDHVALHRPQTKIDSVATGEIWPARLAIDLGLVDELKTSDDLLLEMSTDAEVFLVKTGAAKDWKARLMKYFFSLISGHLLPLAKTTHTPC